LVKNGFRVVRFWNDDVLRRTDVVLEEILRNLQQAPKV
jgi:very-short-patch-repair endonuclease